MTTEPEPVRCVRCGSRVNIDMVLGEARVVCPRPGCWSGPYESGKGTTGAERNAIYMWNSVMDAARAAKEKAQ